MTASLIKVRFEVDISDWQGGITETLWAAPIPGGEGRFFQLRNSPFYKRGINHLDIVSAKPTEAEWMFDFVDVVKRSGHSTYMLLMEPGETRHVSWWNELQKMGCSYERAHVDTAKGSQELYSVDVPPTVDIHKAYDELTRGEQAGIWIFQEGHATLPAPPPAWAPTQKR
jgi:hypothetical protein